MTSTTKLSFLISKESIFPEKTSLATQPRSFSPNLCCFKKQFCFDKNTWKCRSKTSLQIVTISSTLLDPPRWPMVSADVRSLSKTTRYMLLNHPETTGSAVFLQILDIFPTLRKEYSKFTKIRKKCQKGLQSIFNIQPWMSLSEIYRRCALW